MYQPGMVENPELTSVKSLLNVTKILCLIFWILGILWILDAIYTATVLSSIGLGGFVYAGVAYPVLFTILNLLIWMQIPPIEACVNTGQFSRAKEKTLLWAILGFIAGLIPGILLIIAYTKYDNLVAWRSPMMGQPGAQMAWSPTPAVQPPAAWSPAPVAQPQVAWSPTPQPQVASPAQVAPPVQAAPAAPTGTACPRCGNAATWVAQYNRWYCYSCKQYV